MENNEFTDHAFWKAYWESKKNLIFELKNTYELGKLISDIIDDKEIKSGIELGGFPGYYAIMLKKFHHINTTLLDYFIHPEIIKELLHKNQLELNDIEIIQADLFKYFPDKKYDLVLSCGLIEHFEDLRDIIFRHVQFLNPGGTLIITIPNFTGINGWVQRKFDMSNYKKHNIKTMNPNLLLNLCKDLDIKEVKSYYYGKFSVWLESRKEKSIFTRLFVKTIWLAGKIFTRIVPVETKALSPYIILTARK